MEMIALRKPKASIGQSLIIAIGLILAVAGLLMMLSIILFLPGVGAFLIGFLMIWFNRPKETITCRQCSGNVTARLGDKQAKCEHCNTVHPITWTK